MSDLGFSNSALEPDRAARAASDARRQAWQRACTRIGTTWSALLALLSVGIVSRQVDPPALAALLGWGAALVMVLLVGTGFAGLRGRTLGRGVAWWAAGVATLVLLSWGLMCLLLPTEAWSW